MNIPISKLKKGDMIKFKYSGFAKKVGAEGKIVSMPREETGTINIAITSGHVWAVHPINLIILKIVKEDGSIGRFKEDGNVSFI